MILKLTLSDKGNSNYITVKHNFSWHVFYYTINFKLRSMKWEEEKYKINNNLGRSKNQSCCLAFANELVIVD